MKDTMTLPRRDSDRAEKEKRSRVRGVFNGTQQRLNVLKKIDGHELRWFNGDNEDRLLIAQQGGWSFVSDSEIVLEDASRVLSNKTTDAGTHVRKVVGSKESGDPVYAYLMKIRTEDFLEDQLDKIEKVKATETSIRKGKGIASEKLGESAYLPDDRKKSLSYGVGRVEDFARFG